MEGKALGIWMHSELKDGRQPRLPSLFTDTDSGKHAHIKSMLVHMLQPTPNDRLTSEGVVKKLQVIQSK